MKTKEIVQTELWPWYHKGNLFFFLLFAQCVLYTLQSEVFFYRLLILLLCVFTNIQKFLIVNSGTIITIKQLSCQVPWLLIRKFGSWEESEVVDFFLYFHIRFSPITSLCEML